MNACLIPFGFINTVFANDNNALTALELNFGGTHSPVKELSLEDYLSNRNITLKEYLIENPDYFNRGVGSYFFREYSSVHTYANYSVQIIAHCKIYFYGSFRQINKVNVYTRNLSNIKKVGYRTLSILHSSLPSTSVNISVLRHFFTDRTVFLNGIHDTVGDEHHSPIFTINTTFDLYK